MSEVVFLIKHHDDFKVKVWEGWKDKEEEVVDQAKNELLVLRDADMLDTFGAIGIHRVFMFASQVARRLINRVPRRSNTNDQHVISSAEVFFIHQYNAIKELKFATSQKIGQRRMAYTKKYLKEIEREMKELGFV